MLCVPQRDTGAVLDSIRCWRMDGRGEAIERSTARATRTVQLISQLSARILLVRQTLSLLRPPHPPMRPVHLVTPLGHLRQSSPLLPAVLSAVRFPAFSCANHRRTTRTFGMTPAEVLGLETRFLGNSDPILFRRETAVACSLIEVRGPT